MVVTLGNNAPLNPMVKRWVAELKCSRHSLDDDLGRPVAVATPEMVNKIRNIVMADR